MDAQMKKGILELCILYVVSKEELYGYEIMKKMKAYFPDVNESTFYAILRRLNAENHTETYTGEFSNGPQRKYYRITKTGQDYLQDSILDWKAMIETVNQIGIN